MMVRSLITVALLIVLQTGAKAEGLAEKLPEDTIFYLQLSVPEALKGFGDFCRVVDPEATEGTITEFATLKEKLKELAGAYEFEPALLDKIMESRVYLAVMTKRKPFVVVHKYQVPKYDKETFEAIEGEFTEQSYTEVDHYTTSLVVETEEEVAAEFLDQFKGLLERLQEKNPDDEQYGWKEIEVDEGELISRTTSRETIGSHGRLLVLSDDDPRELWSALGASAEKTIAKTDLYQRYVQSEPAPVGLGLLNLEALFKQLAAQLQKKVDDARKAAQAEGKDDNSDDENEFGFDVGAGQVRLQVAEAELQTFQFTNKLLSLDQLKSLGFNFGIGGNDNRAHSEAKSHLLVGERISPTLKQLLNGGKPFQLPPFGERKDLGVFLRMGLGEIFENVLGIIDENDRAQFDQVMGMMKGMVGHNAQDIVGQLAGDIYFLMDINEKEYEEDVYDEESEEFTTKTVKGPRPEFFVLFGVKDREAFGNTLSEIMTRLSSAPFPIVAQILNKRVYQGTNVYLLGQGVAGEGNDPDGLSSYAMVIVDRYLTFGSWKEVTSLIRRANAAERDANESLSSIVAANQDSNFLVALPRAFLMKSKKLTEEDDQKEIGKFFDSFLNSGVVEDEELLDGLKKSFAKLLEYNKAIDLKLTALSPDPTTFFGRLKGQIYELGGAWNIEK